MGPFCVNQSDPTHHLTKPTQLNPLQVEQVVKVIWRKAASHPSWRRILSFRAGDNATTEQAADELICRRDG